MQKIYDICHAREDKEGKTHWDRVGTMLVKEDGKKSMFLPLTGQWYQIFPRRENNDQKEDQESQGEHDEGNTPFD